MGLRPVSASVSAAVLALWIGSAAPSSAVTLSFYCITGNLAGDCAIGEAQLRMDVTDPGFGKIDFAFENAGPARSSITDVYWDDGTLLAILSITNAPGSVQFASPATPAELPGANNASPPFHTSAGFSADSDNPVQPLGVNPGEQLIVTFALIDGQTFADAIQQLANGSLRVGIHVQGFHSGGSESFVNRSMHTVPVPEPGTFAPVAGGLMALSAARRRRA